MEHSQKGMQESMQESKKLRAKLYDNSVLQYGETRQGACYVEGEYFGEEVVITADSVYLSQ